MVRLSITLGNLAFTPTSNEPPCNVAQFFRQLAMPFKGIKTFYQLNIRPSKRITPYLVGPEVSQINRDYNCAHNIPFIQRVATVSYSHYIRP